MKNATIDTQKLIQFFGGKDAVLERLKKGRVKIGFKAVENWYYRGSIPASRLAQLALCALEDGRDFDLINFITTKPTKK